MPLTLADAQRVAAAGVAKAESMGVKISVAVVDARGDLVALARMDGAGFFTSDVARGKAKVSASFGAPSAGFAENAGLPIFQLIDNLAGGGMVFFQGAVPLMKDGQLVGAVGGSGASSQQDEEAAQAAAAAL